VLRFSPSQIQNRGSRLADGFTDVEAARRGLEKFSGRYRTSLLTNSEDDRIDGVRKTDEGESPDGRLQYR